MRPLLRPALHAAAMVLIGLAGALAVLPAGWLAAMLPADGVLSVVDASGSIWAGRARLALGPPGYRRTVPDTVQWRIAWDGGLPQARISHPWLAGPLALRAGLDGLTLSAQSLELPASALSLVHDGIRQIGPEGSVRLQWPATRLGAPPGPGATRLTLEWLHAASAISPVRPLGSYRGTLRQAADGLDLNLESRNGPLLLAGTGRVRAGRLSFDGQASIAPRTDDQTRAALTPLLRTLGPVADGQARISLH